jgi:hypothetical protein
MLKCWMVILLFSRNTVSTRQTDTIIKWSEGYRLMYSDFAGKRSQSDDSTAPLDRLASINCSIKYELKIVNGKREIHAYATMYPQKSWMRVRDPEVLQHEQEHFDIKEIYARKFEKTLNDSVIKDIADYVNFLTYSFKETFEDLKAEQRKYDAWSKNTPGKDYYYNWINEQLFQPKLRQGLRPLRIQ